MLERSVRTHHANVVRYKVTTRTWPRSFHSYWVRISIKAEPSAPNTTLLATRQPTFPHSSLPLAPQVPLPTSFPNPFIPLPHAPLALTSPLIPLTLPPSSIPLTRLAKEEPDNRLTLEGRPPAPTPKSFLQDAPLERLRVGRVRWSMLASFWLVVDVGLIDKWVAIVLVGLAASS